MKQFLITGVVGPAANAHGPNEFLHVGYAKKLTGCVASVRRPPTFNHHNMVPSRLLLVSGLTKHLRPAQVLADHANVPAWLAGCAGDPSTKRPRKDASFEADCC